MLNSSGNGHLVPEVAGKEYYTHSRISGLQAP